MPQAQPIFEDQLDRTLKTILSRLLERAGHIVLQPTERRVINELPKLVGADLFGIYLFNEQQSPYCHLVSSNYEAFIERYEEYRHQDPVLRNLLRHGNISEGSQLLGTEGWERSDLCRMMKNWRLKHSIQAPLIIDNEVAGTINFARSESQNNFSGAEIRRVWELSRTLSGHLEQTSGDTQPIPGQRNPPEVVQPADQDPVVIETDFNGSIISSSEQDWEKKIASGLLTKTDIMQALNSNLKHLRSGHFPTSSTLLNSPPPNAQHLVIISSVVPSDNTRVITSIMQITSLLPQASVNLGVLAPRTREVAELLLRGYSNKMISHEMEISENTVKDHVRKIYHQFGVSSRSELSWTLNSPICT